MPTIIVKTVILREHKEHLPNILYHLKSFKDLMVSRADVRRGSGLGNCPGPPSPKRPPIDQSTGLLVWCLWGESYSTVSASLGEYALIFYG